MKATIIITEKPTISKKIAYALAPEEFDDRGSSKINYNDILAVRNKDRKREIHSEEDLDCEILNQKLDKNNYFCQQECMNCGFEAKHIASMGEKHSRKARKYFQHVNESILSDKREGIVEAIQTLGGSANLEEIIQWSEQEKTDRERTIETLGNLVNQEQITLNDGKYSVTKKGMEEAGKNKRFIVDEQINYYAFMHNGELVIITDTGGNPYRTKLSTRKPLATRIKEVKNWEALEKQLSHVAEYEDRSFVRRRSSKGKDRLFKSLLTYRRLPIAVGKHSKGTSFTLNKVIAATDYDIAGSMIFHSVIEDANAFGKKRKQKTYHTNDEELGRILLKDLSVEGIQEEIAHPLPFDWENAYAGLARAHTDFIVGTSLTSILQNRRQKRSKAAFSVGRNQFLGLETLLQEEENIANEEEQEHSYLIFRGRLDYTAIQEKLRNKDFVAISINSKRQAVSHGTFIQKLEEQKIGTHTTRYQVLNTLAARKVAYVNESHIIPSNYGMLFYTSLAPYLRNEKFNLRTIKEQLKWFMEDLSEHGKGNKELSKELYQAFMSAVLPQTQAGIREVEKHAREVINKLEEGLEAHKNYKEKKQKQKKEEANFNENTIHLYNESSIISPEHIQLLFDTKNKRAREGQNIYLGREFAPIVEDIKPIIGQICQINPDYAFTIKHGFQQNDLYSFGNENYTIFRAEGGEALIHVLQGSREISNYVAQEFPPLETEQEEGAHEPLQLHNPEPSDIAGKEGMRLVEEYNRPWTNTAHKIKLEQEGKKSIQEMNIDGIQFSVLERYTFGEAHNFESLLIAMHDKYKTPFSRTAWLAEQLYLNG